MLICLKVFIRCILRRSLVFPDGTIGKEPPANAGNIRDTDSIPGLEISPGGGHGKSPVFLPGESHGQKSLAGYSS